MQRLKPKTYLYVFLGLRSQASNTLVSILLQKFLFVKVALEVANLNVGDYQ